MTTGEVALCWSVTSPVTSHLLCKAALWGTRLLSCYIIAKQLKSFQCFYFTWPTTAWFSILLSLDFGAFFCNHYFLPVAPAASQHAHSFELSSKGSTWSAEAATRPIHVHWQRGCGFSLGHLWAVSKAPLCSFIWMCYFYLYDVLHFSSSVCYFQSFFFFLLLWMPSLHKSLELKPIFKVCYLQTMNVGTKKHFLISKVTLMPPVTFTWTKFSDFVEKNCF